MKINTFAGKPAESSMPVNVPELIMAYYTEAAAVPDQKELLAKLSPRQVKFTELADEKIRQIRTRVPGNSALIGGLKVIAENGWVEVRPSGAENIYKIYTEGFHGADHPD
jgi:phosphoglucomutase